MTYPPTAPKDSDTAPGTSPASVNMQRRGEGWAPLPNIPIPKERNPLEYLAYHEEPPVQEPKGKTVLVEYPS